MLGDALRKYGRDRATVATKVWTSDDREAERQIRDALSCFGGRVELYQVHNLVAVEKRLSMLEGLKEEGKVRSIIGATHYSHSALAALMDTIRGERGSTSYKYRAMLPIRWVHGKSCRALQSSTSA